MLTMRKFPLRLMLAVLLGLCGGKAGATPSSAFESVSAHVRIFHDIVNVGVIERNGKALLIDSGEGNILKAAKEAGISSIEWVLYTDHEREHCSGAPALKKAGVKIGVPAGEAEYFRNATGLWLGADRMLDHRYDFRPDLDVLRETVAPDRELQPGTDFVWEGLTIQVLPTPGFTDGEVTYIVDIDGRRIAFSGDLISGPGQLWEFYSLQKPFPGMEGNYSDAGHGGYWAFGGAVPELKKSLQTVLSRKPEVLVPARGIVMKNPAESVSLLDMRLDAAMKNYLTLAAWRIYFSERKVDTGYGNVPMLPRPPTPKVPQWLHRLVETSWYIQAEDGSIFLLDCGFAPVVTELRRRSRDGTIRGIDAIWITHYHDDHISSVNKIRREFGAQVYAQKELQDILENPVAYEMPCLFPESIHVDHPLSEGEVVNWKGYKLTAYYFPGQTLYHDGLLVEHDGTRLFMTGDSLANFGIDNYCIYNRNFVGNEPGYEQCLRLLLKLRPDLMIAAHFGPVPFAEENLQEALGLLQKGEKLFSELFPWDSPNFGLDPAWIRVYPFRQSVLPGQPVTVEARIFNHSDRNRDAVARLDVPEGWSTKGSTPISIPPHTEGAIRLTALAPPNPIARREVLGLSVIFDQRNLGERAVAIVDYLQ